jgi:formylglycine-generating enzyme required for sulfatase activity
LLVEKQIGIYEFAHLSFQEYLAAAQIKKTQQENILIDNFNNPWWAETIRLYSSQGDASILIERALSNSDVYSLTLAYDCLEEGLEIDPDVRKKLEDILERGLESDERSIFKMAAEVKLSRRLRNLLVIDDDRSIDQSFITGAEYKLFVSQSSELLSTEFYLIGYAQRPITRISYQDALKFCAWLSSKTYSLALGNQESDEDYYYRLPTPTEVQNYPARDGENSSFECWNIEGNDTRDRSIRVVRTKIPSWFKFDVITVNAQGEEIKQEQWCAQYITEKLTSNISLEMVYIPGGTFAMGSPKGEGRTSEKPQHEVTVPSFYMGKYPITQAQYQQVMSKNPSKFKGDDRPVEMVSWDDAVEFCQRLSKQTGKEYRLPSEAEWEYACRAGTTTAFHFGETITDKLANYNNNVGKTTAVGKYPPNAFGLYDMHGNVWEWCQDNWHDNYKNAPTDGSAWLSRISNTKVLRGGSWSSSPSYCRSASRNDYNPDNRDYSLGLRVVCVAPRTT